MTTPNTPARKKEIPLTKKKPETELELEESKVSKTKTTSIQDFRKALVIGRTNVDKYSKFKNPEGVQEILEIVLAGGDGVESTFKFKYNIKRLKAGDYVKLHQIRKKMVKGEEVEIMSEYAASVIIGCVDEMGARIFSPADAEILDHAANGIAILEASNSVLASGGATGDQDAVEKPV